MLFTRYTKALLTNKSLWGWGVLFMVFWLVLGAFVESTGLPKDNEAVALAYTGSWYGVITLFSLSALATTVAFSLIYSTYSLAYSFRFTKLKPHIYLANSTLSTLIMGLILSAIMLVSTYGLFGYRFGVGVAPHSPLLVVPIAALSATFMFGLSTLLVLVLINWVGLKSQSFVSFVPLILGYAFGFSQLFVATPKLLVYASPYTDIQDLLYYAYTGGPVTLVFANPSSATLNPYYLALSLVVWVAVLLLADSHLLGRIRTRNIEEGRQV